MFGYVTFVYVRAYERMNSDELLTRAVDGAVDEHEHIDDLRSAQVF